MEPAKIHILMIEDDSAQAGLIKEMLAESRKQDFVVSHVKYLADGLEILNKETFDCVLVDLGLPDSRGLESALLVRKCAKRVAIVVLTALDDEDAALRSLQMDIQDYLIKNEINAALLTRSIRYAIQRKRVALALWESEQRFTSFMANMPAAWMKDMTGRYRYANAETQRIFVRPEREILGRTDEEILPPETARQLQEHDRRALDEGSIQVAEMMMEPDGTEHSYQINKFVVPNPEGEPAFVAGVAFDTTGLRRAEEAQKNSEQRFSNIFHASPTLIFLSSLKEGRIIDINEAVLETLGYRREELIGRTSLEINLWADPELRSKLVRELEAKRPVRNLEISFRPRAGLPVIGLLSAELIEIDGEQCILTLVGDITERKRAEEAVVRAKEEWERTFDSVPDLIAILDDNYRIIRLNRAMAERIGREADDCIGLPCYSVLHGTAKPIESCPHAHTLQDGREHSAEVHDPYLRGDFLVSTSPLILHNGTACGIVHVARDITELKKAEAEIKLLNAELTKRAAELEAANARQATDLDAIARLQRLGALFVAEEDRDQILGEIVDTAIAISGADFGNIQMMDHRTGRLRMVAHRGFPSWWLDFWKNVAEGEGACGTALDQGRRVIVEDVAQSPIFVGTEALEIQRKAGVQAVQSTPLISGSDRVMGMVSTHYRVPRQPSERELRLLDLLARNVADFLERAELRQMLAARAAELEDANKELETFNYTAAHDLRQPLNLISVYIQTVEMLCGDKVGEECLGYLRGTHGAVKRMSQLIEALLKYSRLGRIEVNKKEVDLSEMAQDVAEESKKAEPEREVLFRIAAGIKVKGDGNLLRMVLENLIGNAWKYTRMKENTVPLIQFGAAEVDGEAAYFVRDNGPGFDMAEGEKLFTPFMRLSGAEVLGGFGIGLATVERIIHRHGGRVWAEGVVGEGATFYFTLPDEWNDLSDA